ncbi:MAG TPA: ADP-glyceromanno-heptose 6-epimerase [Saprospiraceae bacterium]|nr:ADP-glyceromanno-heptose 6-epimerase [Saprospiraceae bacterium]
MIAITGAYGFIGSCLVNTLLQQGYNNIIAVDDFSQTLKSCNLPEHSHCLRVDRKKFFVWIDQEGKKLDWIIHLGARTDTTEQDETILLEWNVHFSMKVWQKCCEYDIGLIYASSAATYGDGQTGFSDNHALLPRLVPLNPYGWSKHHFDMWALSQKIKPPRWYGLKLYNIYGPNEYHKGKMASIVYQAYQQITATGSMKLFKSYHPQYADGRQLRDFLYVKDVLKIIVWLIFEMVAESGIYNVGKGNSDTFQDLVETVFEALQVPVRIQYIDIPDTIKDQYQYNTSADIRKLIRQGFELPFYSLREGIFDYINKYLQTNSFLH